MAQVPLQDYNKSTLQVPANAGGSNFLKDEDISSASSSGSSSPANQSGDGSHLGKIEVIFSWCKYLIYSIEFKRLNMVV